MLDYCAWINRARRFLQTVAHLPGMIRVSNSIAAPEETDFYRESVDELRGVLPDSVHRFVSDASSRCAFWFEWTPPPAMLNRLQRFYPALESLNGGGDLCEKAAYSNYANRGVLEKLLPGFGGMFDAEPPYRDGLVWIVRASGVEECDVVLDFRSGANGAVVIEDRLDWSKLSENFDQFLMDWETIRYARLSKQLLAPWLDAHTGMLRPDRELAARWQAFFEEAAIQS